jgi:hypothetical protein
MHPVRKPRSGKKNWLFYQKTAREAPKNGTEKRKKGSVGCFEVGPFFVFPLHSGTVHRL